MLRPIRITLVVLFVLLLLGAGGLYYYNYTHEDVSRPAFTVDEERAGGLRQRPAGGVHPRSARLRQR